MPASQFILNTLAYGDTVGWDVWLLEHYNQHLLYNQVLATSVSVISLTLTSGGSGYHSVPSIAITGGSPTTQATAAVSSIVAGVITGIVLTNGGAGYSPGTSLSVVFSGGTPTTPATATAALANPVILQVYPILRMDWTPHHLQEWLDMHEHWHEDVRPFANVTGVDLSVVNLQKPDEFYSWVDVHNQEHQFLDRAFGVT